MRRQPLFLHAAQAALLVVLLTPLCEARVSAQAATVQPSAAEPPGYRDAIDAAVAAFETHDVEEARSLFARADALFPNARTQRGLGLAEFELRNYVQSIKHLEAALDSQVRPLDGELRKLTERQLGKARTFVGEYVIASKPTVTGLRVDGFETELPASGALMLRVGDHELELLTDSHQPERRRLNVKGGESETLNIIFAKSVNVIHGPADATPAPTHWYENPWIWVAAGVVVAGATTTAIVAANSGSAPVNGGTTGISITAP